METGSLFSKQDYSTELKKYVYLLKENHLCYKQEQLGHCFPVELSLFLKGILPASKDFQCGDKISLLNRAIQVS